jgi:hypothetical protein
MYRAGTDAAEDRTTWFTNVNIPIASSVIRTWLYGSCWHVAPAHVRRSQGSPMLPTGGQIFHALERHKECQTLEGHLMPDHVHMCIAIPPNHPVAVLGNRRGRGAGTDFGNRANTNESGV